MVTLDDVKKLLKQNHVPDDRYSLDGSFADEKYCLVKVYDCWEVYYSERGQKAGLREFSSESDACEYFLMKLRKAGYL